MADINDCRSILANRYIWTLANFYYSSASSDHRYLRRDGFALGLGFRRALPWRSLAFYLCWRSYYCELPAFALSTKAELEGQHVPLLFLLRANTGN